MTDDPPGRDSIVTDSERLADQMRRDVLDGKIDRAGRQVVRRALDAKDAPPTAGEVGNQALGRISRGGL